MELNLTDKTALVTGASKGIGRAVAWQLAREGVDVAITARTASDLEATAKEISNSTGRKVVPLAGDMSRTEDVNRCVAEAMDALGSVDILVTCAGSSPGGLLEELTDEQWLESLGLKFLGYVRTVRAVVPHMVKAGSGSIVLVVGNDGLKPSFWEMTAGAANAADINFASSIADQYGPKGIRVNTVNPGPVDTDRWDTLEKAFARDMGVDQAEARRRAEASIPVGKITQPEEVAALVAFLASDLATTLHGAHIPIDGGQRKPLMER
ncbi:SDR family NAD(P)-dependent oxidoreductase [Mycobacterium sp. NAZ190054]|uniref:SDR family NAD(P)-dependent oxidoreductase n=1 Tax=Mycobacterium sp. NAZ190054 TaxID=1747766 RepID=UPI00079892E6|nr:SDR family NAD(P)-dependent oxidoreductase [Mycobacterium sp. NAZ190054]KWX68277.1 short-chain dehydrogenase [Mycobacterium sp. NAZ190054]